MKPSAAKAGPVAANATVAAMVVVKIRINSPKVIFFHKTKV